GCAVFGLTSTTPPFTIGTGDLRRSRIAHGGYGSLIHLPPLNPHHPHKPHKPRPATILVEAEPPVSLSNACGFVSVTRTPLRPAGTPRFRAGSAFAAAQAESATSAEPQESDPWKVKVLYDGDCPICMKQVEFLSARNKEHRTLKFVDISSEWTMTPMRMAASSTRRRWVTCTGSCGTALSSKAWTPRQAMGHMHGVLRDGTVVKSMDVIRVSRLLLRNANGPSMASKVAQKKTHARWNTDGGNEVTMCCAEATVVGMV
ncbi:unnamed protein product, partial [Closterium sp. Yama58-4]